MSKTINEYGWGKFYKDAKEQPPAPVLGEAISFVPSKESVLELGPGNFTDVNFLLSEGFKKITAVDKESIAENYAPKNTDQVQFIVSRFEDFDFPQNTYNLVDAQFSLPFVPPANFTKVFTRIKDSLKQGGVFCGQMFGPNDEWNNDLNDFTFHTEEEVKQLIGDMEVLKFEEKERDSYLADGTQKHKHYFNIIARKI